MTSICRVPRPGLLLVFFRGCLLGGLRLLGRRLGLGGLGRLRSGGFGLFRGRLGRTLGLRSSLLGWLGLFGRRRLLLGSRRLRGGLKANE